MDSMPSNKRLSDKSRREVGVDRGSTVSNDSVLVSAPSNLQIAASPFMTASLAFEEMTQEGGEQANKERHVIHSTLQAPTLENALQQDSQGSHKKERHLESRLFVMERELSRVTGTLREVELALSVEQERRREALLEVDQVLENLKEEKRTRGEYEEKLKRLSSFLNSMKEKLMPNIDDAEENVANKLASVSKDLDKELQRMSSKKLSKRRSKLIEQSTQWKLQRDAAVKERDILEERLNSQMRRERDREAEMEAMWAEREKNLIIKCTHLEATVDHWESKYKKRDTEALQERKLSDIELEAHRAQWSDEKAGWEAFVLKREQWLEEQVMKWTSLLDAKDRGLNSLKKELEELEKSFKNVKHALENPFQVHDQPKQMLETCSQTDASCESFKGDRSSDESDEESCQSIERIVHEVDTVEDEQDAELDPGTCCIEKLKRDKVEIERKASNTPTLTEEMQTEFQNRLKQFDIEKKNLEVKLSSKTAEAEDLVAHLNARERQMEALMQKFRDEVLSIDREVEKERKEREEVMEMHFAGKRRLVAEIREKEESWQNDLDAITQELLESREWARQKEEDVINLKEDLEALDEQRKDEEERLSKRIHSLLKEQDSLTVALEQEQRAREAAEAEYQRLEEEHIILLEELSAERQRKLEGTDSWGSSNLQAAVCRVVNVDKQIEEAMHAIVSLREELDNKETQLIQAKMDKEAEWERRQAALVQEYKELLSMREQKWQQGWIRKEQELLAANDKLLHQLADERGETALVRGALRELEWSIKHGDIDVKGKLANIPKKEGMVKVHTSHLEEVDQYMLDLQKKLEESEKKRKTAEIAASVRELKRGASLDTVQGDRDRSLSNIVGHDGLLTSHLSLESGTESLRIRTKSSIGDRNGRNFSSIRDIQQDAHWDVENFSGAGRHGGNIGSSTSHGQPRDDYSLLGLPPVSPGRRQQKWLVDAAWLENVRKEQTFLRQQLEIERQRVCSFGQVDAENRLIEAAVVRAMEEKHESESKVLDLQQEVSMLRKMLAARSETGR